VLTKSRLNGRQCLVAIVVSLCVSLPQQTIASATTTFPDTPHDLLLINQAMQEKIGACMQRNGFRYMAEPGGIASITSPLPYSIPTLSFARSNGFGGQVSIDPNQAYTSKLSKFAQQRYVVALFGARSPTKQVLVAIPQGGRVGHSMGGCQAAAERALYSNFEEWFKVSTVVENYQVIAQSEMNRSPRFGHYLTSWRDCARDRGFNWSNPLVAISSYSHLPNKPSKSEISAAVVVSDCAARTGFLGEVSRLFDRYLTELPNDYRKEVRVYWKMQAKAVSAANAIKH
jgi:hypothetical protein